LPISISATSTRPSGPQPGHQHRPSYTVAFNIRGLSYAGKGEVDRAIRTSIRLSDRRNSPSLTITAARLIKAKKYDGPSGFEQAIRFNPAYDVAYYNRGMAYQDRREFILIRISRGRSARPKKRARLQQSRLLISQQRRTDRAIAD
jgi:hypothetical protein